MERVKKVKSKKPERREDGEKPIVVSREYKKRLKKEVRFAEKSVFSI